MANFENGSMLKAYMKAGSMRISRTNIMRDDAIKNILKLFLAAGDEALANGNIEKAERFYHEIVKLAAKELPEAAPETALAKFNLSMLYLDRGQTTEALAFAQASVDMFTDLFGVDHPSTGMALHQLSEVQLARQEKASCQTKVQVQRALEGPYRQYQRNFDQCKSHEFKETTRSPNPYGDAVELLTTGSMLNSLN